MAEALHLHEFYKSNVLLSFSEKFNSMIWSSTGSSLLCELHHQYIALLVDILSTSTSTVTIPLPLFKIPLVTSFLDHDFLRLYATIRATTPHNISTSRNRLQPAVLMSFSKRHTISKLSCILLGSRLFPHFLELILVPFFTPLQPNSLSSLPFLVQALGQAPLLPGKFLDLKSQEKLHSQESVWIWLFDSGKKRNVLKLGISQQVVFFALCFRQHGVLILLLLLTASAHSDLAEVGEQVRINLQGATFEALWCILQV